MVLENVVEEFLRLPLVPDDPDEIPPLEEGPLSLEDGVPTPPELGEEPFHGTGEILLGAGLGQHVEMVFLKSPGHDSEPRPRRAFLEQADEEEDEFLSPEIPCLLFHGEGDVERSPSLNRRKMPVGCAFSPRKVRPTCAGSFSAPGLRFHPIRHPREEKELSRMVFHGRTLRAG